MYVLPYGQMSLWGKHFCLKCIDFLIFLCSNINIFYNILNLSNPILIKNINKNQKIAFSSLNTLSTKLISQNRIGPHNIFILSIIFGSLLGDGFAEKRKQGNGTRICFYQEASHLSYLIYLHKLISDLEYCNKILPQPKTRLGKGGIVRRISRFSTWTYSSFNWIQELWYVDGIKKVPENIGEYLTPVALAIWIMDDGSKSNKGLKLATNSFTFSDCNLLVKVLNENFQLKSSVQSAGVENQYVIYIWKESMPILRKIVLPFFDPSMKYKIIE